MNPAWADNYLGLIFQFYGLAFFVLGVTALLSARRQGAPGSGSHMSWLAAFGMLHGLQEFIHGERLHNPAGWLIVVGSALMVASFLALLEFGRRLWNERPGGSRRLPAVPLYTAAGLGAGTFMLASADASAGLELGARYLLGAPGAALIGVALLLQASATVRAPDTIRLILWLRISALAMLGYAVLTVFLSPVSGNLLTDWLPTTADFLATTGLPVQLARALCAVLLAAGFIMLHRYSSAITTTTLQRVLDNLNGFVYRCRNDQAWTVTFMSDGVENLCGYPAVDFLRGERHFADQIHPDDQQHVWDGVQAALEAHRDFQLQYRMIDAAGVVRWCYEEGRGVFDTQGELLYLEGLVRNDQARHHADSARRQMQAVVEASPQAMGWADPDGTGRYFNAALRTLLAVPEGAEISGYRLRDFYDEKAYEQIESTALPAVMAQEAWVGEVELTALDGRRVPSLHSVFALRDEAGEITAFANVITDLSEIRAAQRNLLIKETAIASANNAISLAGMDGLLTYANKAFVELWGLASQEEALGRSALSFWDDPEQARTLLDDLIKNTGRYEGELVARRADGSLLDVQVMANMVIGPDGEPVCLIGSFLDVSARNQAQQSLQQERNFARSLVDTAPIIVLLMDPHGMIQHVNPWFEQLTGYRLDEIAGKEWFATFLPARDQARVRNLFASAIQEQPVRGNINPIVTRSGEEREIEWHAEVLCDTDGQMIGLLSIGLDVTERQQFDNRLRELNQSLEQRVAERTAELERANAAKNEFLSRMSHELRTPLNAILGFTQVLQLPDEQPLSAQQDDNVREIRQAGEHLLALVNEILDLAHIESGALEFSPETVALCPVIEHCAAQIEPAARERGIQPTLQLHASCTVLADPVRLKQVLFNLLSNAIKYNREGGAIEIESAPTEGQRVRVSVRDTGRGLSAGEQARLFRPFARLESAYDGTEGTGIGLALSKQLVEGMQGRIGVDSVPGEGSTFWFELPQCSPSVPADAPGVNARANTVGETRTVLYVEDNPANLRLVQRILDKRADVQLIVAETAEDGLELASRERPDLILLDINLPGMDGFAALKKLRADPATEAIPVIAISANAMQRDIERAQAAQFQDYIVKPINIGDFLASIEPYLREPGKET